MNMTKNLFYSNYIILHRIRVFMNLKNKLSYKNIIPYHSSDIQFL